MLGQALARVMCVQTEPVPCVVLRQGELKSYLSSAFCSEEGFSRYGIVNLVFVYQNRTKNRKLHRCSVTLENIKQSTFFLLLSQKNYSNSITYNWESSKL